MPVELPVSFGVSGFNHGRNVGGMTTGEPMDAYYEQFVIEHPEVASRRPGLRSWVMAALSEGPDVLDMGCGLGDLLLALQQVRPRWRVVGVDISACALDVAKSRGVVGELIHASVVPVGPWQTVILAQVLEHLEDDMAMVEAAVDALRSGGLLVVSVPFEAQVQSLDHKREYTVSELRTFLEGCGLNPTLIEWPGMATRIIMKARNL